MEIITILNYLKRFDLLTGVSQSHRLRSMEFIQVNFR
jgi:hypothetical protein